MAENIILDDSIGWAIFEIAGAEITVDIFAAYNRIHAIAQKLKDRPNHEYHGAIVDLMKELGFPAVSHRTANGFSERIMELASGVKKNSPAMPESPGSTESTPSA